MYNRFLGKSISQHRSSEETASMLREAYGRGIHSASTELIPTLDDTNDEDNILNIDKEIPTSYTTAKHKLELRSSSNHDVISVQDDHNSVSTELISTLEDTNDEDNILNINIENPMERNRPLPTALPALGKNFKIIK